MRRVVLCLTEIALVTVLALACSVVIMDVESQFYYYPEVTVSPSTPTTSDNVNITVSFYFASFPPHVEEFGNVVRDGNILSVNATVYVPAPGDIVLFIVHTDLITYSLGNLSVGEYEFKVLIKNIHYFEGIVYGRQVLFNVTFPGDIDHDLDVDILDVVKCAIAYGSTPLDVNWNAYCDIAEPHGIIDIFDLVLMANNYGKEYTPWRAHGEWS